VLPEICCLLQTRIGAAAEERFLRAVAEGEFRIEFLDQLDVERAVELVAVYTDMPLGFVDASVMALAERNGTREILTTDRRHFSVVRPRHARRFTLLP
jgi:predicted nucleic acid-binding protein